MMSPLYSQGFLWFFFLFRLWIISFMFLFSDSDIIISGFQSFSEPTVLAVTNFVSLWLFSVSDQDGNSLLLFRLRFFLLFILSLLSDSGWTYMVSLFAASFYISWLMFAVLYFIVCYLHGDLLPGRQNVCRVQEISSKINCWGRWVALHPVRDKIHLGPKWARTHNSKKNSNFWAYFITGGCKDLSSKINYFLFPSFKIVML